jgi:hypothetical protein
MANTQETRSAPLGLRVTPTLKKALEKAASDDHRPLASYVERLLIEHLKAKGYLTATDFPAASRRSQAVTALRAAGAAIDRAQNRDPDTPADVKAYRKKKLMKIPSKLTKRST